MVLEVKVKRTIYDYILFGITIAVLILSLTSILIAKSALNYVKEEQEPNLIVTKGDCPEDILNYVNVDDLEIINIGNIPTEYELIIKTKGINCRSNPSQKWLNYATEEKDIKEFFEIFSKDFKNNCTDEGVIIRERPYKPQIFFYVYNKVEDTAEITIDLEYINNDKKILKNIMSCKYKIHHEDDGQIIYFEESVWNSIKKYLEK